MSQPAYSIPTHPQAEVLPEPVRLLSAQELTPLRELGASGTRPAPVHTTAAPVNDEGLTRFVTEATAKPAPPAAHMSAARIGVLAGLLIFAGVVGVASVMFIHPLYRGAGLATTVVFLVCTLLLVREDARKSTRRARGTAPAAAAPGAPSTPGYTVTKAVKAPAAHASGELSALPELSSTMPADVSAAIAAARAEAPVTPGYPAPAVPDAGRRKSRGGRHSR